jgi:hypothetical protein
MSFPNRGLAFLSEVKTMVLLIDAGLSATAQEMIGYVHFPATCFLSLECLVIPLTYSKNKNVPKYMTLHKRPPRCNGASHVDPVGHQIGGPVK